MELIVFDMAGTTVDEQNIVYKTVHQAILRAGFTVDLDTVLFHAAGKEKFQAIQDVLRHIAPEVGLEQATQIHRDFEALLEAAYRNLTPLAMPGANEVFAALRAKGIKIALNTGYKQAVAEDLITRIGWEEGQDFDLLLTADDVAKSRPAPDMILLAMARFGLNDASKVAKIGDSIVDIEEGKNAGCGLIAGITTGAQTEAQLLSARPTHVFHALTELLNAL